MARVSDAHLEARRQSILAAATKIFCQKGIATATMAEIASEANISPGAIYRYFENKEQLAEGCMNESADAIKAAWVNPSDVEMSFSELAAMTFAAIDSPEESVDTQLFLERLLIATRSDDPRAMQEFGDDHGRVLQGIAFLSQRQFGDRLSPFDLEQLSGALHAFYWGARLVKLMVPGSQPVPQYKQIEKAMNLATGLEE